MNKRVEFAYPREVDGKQYKADQAAEFDAGVAADLVSAGVARYADEKPTAGKKEG